MWESESAKASVLVSAAMKIDDLCDRFEAQWRAGERPSLNKFLGDVDEQLRTCALAELLRIELAVRHAQGQTPNIREYLKHFSQEQQVVESVFGTLEGDLDATSSFFGRATHGASAALEFEGHELLEEIGRGGMGVVYRAIDKRENRIVALKTLHGMEPSAIYRLKQEFRSLANVMHPNLVSLYGLTAHENACFLTMEYIDGVSLRRYIRPARANGFLSTVQLNRLRDALEQIIAGVFALHEAGKLHRDIKPRNIRVAHDGRIVLLDFGLAADLESRNDYLSAETSVVGTIAYMSPEQAAGEPVTTATDWYSVGATMYELLTGRLPFDGTPLQVLQAKQMHQPPPPSSIAQGVPNDLDKLCIELLSREPERRPTHEGILRLLKSDRPIVAPTGHDRHDISILMGRDAECRMLREAHQSVVRGRARTLLVTGKSGSGKSALLQHFVQELTLENDVLVLSGRCYEQESVPFKAMDGLIDALSKYLRTVPNATVRELIPSNVTEMLRVFPVLRQVKEFSTFDVAHAEALDAQELRRRAFSGLRDLFGRLGDRHDLLLWIDDLQWGDVDSARLLGEILRMPDAPRMLVVGCCREEDVRRSSFMNAMRSSRLENVQRVELKSLSVDDAERLAQHLLDSDQGASAARSIAVESGGSPFFIQELSRHIRTKQFALEARDGVSLDDVVWQRVIDVSSSARRLLEVLAVYGRPLRVSTLCRAANLLHDRRATFSRLRAERLIRATGASTADRVECYHDRIRETILDRLTLQRRRDCHAELAVALQQCGECASEELALHFAESGAREEAASYYLQSARNAEKTLAFDQAAEFYRRAIDQTPEGSIGFRDLLKLHAQSLANAGRGKESADRYLQAARSASASEATQLKQLAAEQLLNCGEVREGLSLAKEVLTSVGVSMPRTAKGALLSSLVEHARLRIRGYRIGNKKSTTPVERARASMCWGLATGLAIVDPIRSSDFQARALKCALAAHDSVIVAKSLALQAAHTASRNHQDASKLLALAEQFANDSGDVNSQHFVVLMKSTSLFAQGHWKKASESLIALESKLRSSRGATWEISTAQSFLMWALYYQGEIKQLADRLPHLCREALERGNLYAFANHQSFGQYLVHLANDNAAVAEAQLARLVEQWSHEGPHIQHINAWGGQVQTALYLGKPNEAWNACMQSWPRFSKACLFLLDILHVYSLHMRGRCALAVAAHNRNGSRAYYLRIAHRDAKRISRYRARWAEPMSIVLMACIAASGNDKRKAASLLTNAASSFIELDMGLFAASAQYALGSLSPKKHQLDKESAHSWMRGQGIANPGRMAAMLVPACFEVD